ncbi:hypothetical protein [Rhizobium aegyptiacum]|uniref:hypothetical protein n=1 Tax=Rhizobium aegyptiacum TaxID=1764550 RepID=UPI0007E5ABCC|nr:hypothetical protein [Rhizobium aegyptiacum]
MRFGNLFRYIRIILVALVAASPLGMGPAKATVPSRHSAITGEHHLRGHPCGQRAVCCSMMHCCPILPDFAGVAAPSFDSMRHEPMPSAYRPLLLIRRIDPPPRTSVA